MSFTNAEIQQLVTIHTKIANTEGCPLAVKERQLNIAAYEELLSYRLAASSEAEQNLKSVAHEKLSFLIQEGLG